MPPSPTGRERTFPRDELIVSKTDTQGRITYANDVFLRVSGYTADEVMGRPHNIIRHPQMPRGVFKLLWDTLEDGHEVFAYIDNLAGDGANYWVLAHITPTYDDRGRLDGYHSNRRAPVPDAVRAVQGIYRRMLEVESRQSGARAAAEAGLAELRRTLDHAGQTYDEFVWSIIESARSAA